MMIWQRAKHRQIKFVWGFFVLEKCDLNKSQVSVKREFEMVVC